MKDKLPRGHGATIINIAATAMAKLTRVSARCALQGAGDRSRNRRRLHPAEGRPRAHGSAAERNVEGGEPQPSSGEGPQRRQQHEQHAQAYTVRQHHEAQRRSGRASRGPHAHRAAKVTAAPGGGGSQRDERCNEH